MSTELLLLLLESDCRLGPPLRRSPLPAFSFAPYAFQLQPTTTTMCQRCSVPREAVFAMSVSTVRHLPWELNPLGQRCRRSVRILFEGDSFLIGADGKCWAKGFYLDESVNPSSSNGVKMFHQFILKEPGCSKKVVW